MINIEEENSKKVTAVLVGAPGVDLSELRGLCETLELEIVREISLTRLEPSPAYGMGSGKAEEISALAKELNAELIVFDFEMESRKQRNWEKLAKIPVIDRQEVILRIFASRARTKEAVLQVQLARLEYSLPRLAHMYGDMARQRGGNYGSKGSGETQLELDQRQVRENIRLVKKELAQVVQDRQTQRKRREKTPCPQVAIVGYTNAGKSTLLNALTGAEVFVEDKLFATLDPTTRRLNLETGGSILLTDTVGFISNLPHSLVNAFKSTLEEARTANLNLIVLDSSDEKVLSQYETVMKVLKEIDALSSPQLIVLNKTDAADKNAPFYLQLCNRFPDAIKISAKEHTGFTELSEKICDTLLGKVRSLLIPAEKYYLVNDIRKNGILIKEEWLDNNVKLFARIGNEDQNNRLLAQFSEYLLK